MGIKTYIAKEPHKIHKKHISEEVLEKLKEKLSSGKTTKEWVENFYKNPYLKLDKEKMIAEHGAHEVKKHGLEFILNNKPFHEIIADKRELLPPSKLIERCEEFSDADLKKIFRCKIEDNYGTLAVENPKDAKFHAEYFKSMPSELQNDREFAIKVLKINKYILFYLPKDMYNDYEVMKAAFSTENSGYLLKDEKLPSYAKANVNVVTAAIEKNPEVLYFSEANFDEKAMEDLEVLKKKRWKELEDEYGNFWYKRQFMENCDSEGYVDAHGSYTLESMMRTTNDAPLCYDSVRNEFFFDKHGYSVECDCGAYFESGSCCEFCGSSEYDDYEDYEDEDYGDSQDYEEEEYVDYSDFESVLKAVKEDGENLKYASKDLRNNLEIAKASVNQTSYAYKLLSSKLKAVDEIAKNAVLYKSYGRVNFNEENYMLLPQKFKNDKNFILKILKNDESNLSFEMLSSKLQKDSDVIKIILSNSSYDFPYFPDKFKKDKEIAKIVLSENGDYLYHFSDEIQADEELALLAIEDDYRASKFISEDLLKNKEFILKVIEANQSALNIIWDYLPTCIKQDEEILKFQPK